MNATASRVGLGLAGLHLLLFLGSVLYVYTASDGQSPLIWVVWAVADFPVSLLYVALAEPYSLWLGQAMEQHAWVQHVLYLPHVVHGLLGTVWWYLVPRLVLPKRLGGIWGRDSR